MKNTRNTEDRQRRLLLEKIRTALLSHEGVIFLKGPLRVQADDCGCEEELTIRRVSRLYPGAPEGSLCFHVSDYYTTDNLTTESLRRIAARI